MIIPVAKRLQQVEEYYFSRKLEEIRSMNARGLDVINLGIGSPDLAPSQEVIDSLCHSANQPGNHGYQPYRGIAALRTAMAQWYQQVYGVSLDPEKQILPLMGSKEGIFHISMAFLNPGDQVLVPDPGYPGYAGASRLAGADAMFYRLDPDNQWQPHWQELDKLDTERVRIMWINYPHMPTGALAKKSTFSKLVSWCVERNIMLCHDNPYSLILNPERPYSLHRIPGALDHCLELNSLSKGHHLAGWRVGMVTGHPEYLNAIVQVKSNIDSGMFKGIQDAAATAMNIHSGWHQAQNDIYKTRKKLVESLMDLLGCSYAEDTAGLFVWAKLPSDIFDTTGFTDHILKNAHVFIVPGTVFGAAGAGYVRASLCLPESKIREAINRIKNIKIPIS